MDDALPISSIERHGAFEDNADHPVHGQQLVDSAILFERETVDVLHGQISEIIFNDGFVNLNNIGVIEALGDHALVLKELAHAPRHGRTILPEADHLDGDLAIGIRVITEVYRGGRALAELANHPIFADFFHSGCAIETH